MEMVYPKDLLRYFELTGFREETVLEKDRFGVESGELIHSTDGQEWDAINEENNQLRFTFFNCCSGASQFAYGFLGRLCLGNSGLYQVQVRAHTYLRYF